ncbi:Acyl-CoA synthetase short-chain family member 3, mitochondrial [Portunus trituberculatus]|uniref:Acyl-CoA synthetase short-chain family member 3, mitochondrial n=1 Tax=Portunus trituberculatus TaxID=210409 RepID=A0A5B7FAQ9_PORTR|nr:Acyl-CoA synthetase short-chain family member 3, mitochondrial [Portunus trituberculatus]
MAALHLTKWLTRRVLGVGVCGRRYSVPAGPAGSYDELHRRSLAEPEQFWDEVGRVVEWYKPYERVLDDSRQPFTQWYSGGLLNTCHNAVDRHVAAGRGDQLAVIHDSPITGSLSSLTFSQLQEATARLAGGLARLGVTSGDTVLIYMPMVAEAVVAMLAVTRLGAAHSLAIELSTHKPQHCVLLQRDGLPQATLTPGRDHDWQELVATSPPHDAVPVPSDHPCYILYTSGTTGQPKGVVRPTGGHAAVLTWTMKAIYGIDTGEVWWAASDLGWIVGHSYICYAPLLAGVTTVVYEGKPVGTPDPGQFFRVVAQHGVSGMFTAPTALRSILQKDPDGAYSRAHDISSLRNLFVAGEPLDHETRVWTEGAFGEEEGDEVGREVVKTVREQVGPVAAFRLAVPVSGLPRTRSGKTARKSIKDLACEKQIKVGPTVENPAVYGGEVLPDYRVDQATHVIASKQDTDTHKGAGVRVREAWAWDSVKLQRLMPAHLYRV